jgi:hypothetical protein
MTGSRGSRDGDVAAGGPDDDEQPTVGVGRSLGWLEL